MEAKLKCRKCRKGVLHSSNTKYCCYDCQRLNSLHRTGEGKVTCRSCRGEFLVASNTSIYRCPMCQTSSNSISGNGQSNEDGGMQFRLTKLGTRNSELSLPYGANKNAYFLNYRSSPSTGSSSFLNRRCNKRAVLCGVSYRKRKFRLKGTINDVRNMRELLIKIFDFPSECIRVLAGQEPNTDLVPTKKNILESLKWLVEDCQPGDSLVFYFSGHGLQTPDFKDDEADGFDETICPVDFIQEGIIIDNDLNSIIVWPLKKGVTLHAIVDACHSGTILDLTHVYNLESCSWKDNKPLAKEPTRKHTNGGLAICLSACEDSQMAADTTAFHGKGMNGVMTYLLTKTIKQNPDITYGDLLEKIREETQEILRSNCRPSFLQHVFHPRITQDPILSSSEPFDASKRIFTL